MTGTSRRTRLIYRWGSRWALVEPTLRCSGSLRADDIEPQVWAAVVHILERPELIASEMARQGVRADEQRAEVQQQLTVIETALVRCDREAQRWAEAYASEVIDVGELKSYKRETDARRQSLVAERDACQRHLEAIGVAVQQVEALTGYCARVRDQLQTFSHQEKRLALEALGIRVAWTPGQPLIMQGTIPLGTIAAIPPTGDHHPRRQHPWPKHPQPPLALR